MTGNSVIIEHMPGLFSLYFHMSVISVAVGDVVEKGQLIGQVGMTGLATGPHLHWEVDACRSPVDPDALASAPSLTRNPISEDIEAQQHRREVIAIAYIEVSDDEPLEKAIKRFKRQVEKEGIIREWKKREFFEKPSAILNRKKKALERKRMKRARKVSAMKSY